MKSTLVFLVLLLGLAGCDTKRVQRTQHEPERGTGTTLNPDGTRFEDLHIDTLDSEKVLNDMSAADSPETIQVQMSSVGKLLFDPKLLGDRQSRYAKKMENLLSAYNSGILRLAKSNVNIDGHLDSYERALFDGCSPQLKGCLNVLFFKRDYRSLDVVLKLVDRMDKKLGDTCQGDCLQNIKKYYDLLGMAFDIKNAPRHTDMEFYYLKRAREYARYYNSLQERDRQNDFFKRHGLIFENIVSQYPADPKNPRFADFVRAFKPWSYSRLNADPFPFGVQRMFNYAASHYLYSGSELNKDLIDAIEISQIEQDKAGSSFLQTLVDLNEKPESRQIFKNLKVDPDLMISKKIYNEYFFMIDRLYRGHLGIEEVNAIWAGSKKDLTKLIEIVEYYAKVEIIKKIVATNLYMTAIFQRKDIPNDALFKKVIQDSEPLAKEWGIVLGNIDRVSMFVTRQLKESRIESKMRRDAENMLGSVKGNIRYLSTYPNMLLLGYVMISLNASAKFKTWFGLDLTIDPSTVINLLLDGEFSPWFIFSSDTDSLDRFQMIYAYHYALNTGAFETYSLIKDEKGRAIVDRVSFFRKVFKQALKSELEEIEKGIRAITDKLEGSKSYSSFVKTCDFEMQNKKNYVVTMPLVELQTHALFGNGSSGLLAHPSEFYSGSGPSGVIATIRNRIEPRLAQTRAMLAVLKSNIAKMDSSPQTQAQIEEAEKDIQSIEALKKSFYKEILGQHKKISKCFNKLRWLERERESLLLHDEINHYRSIYHDMVKRRSSGEKVPYQYSFSRLALLKRLAQHSSKYQPAIEFEDPDNDVADGLGRKLEKIDFINPLTEQVVSEEEFVSQGMKIFNPPGSDTILWLQESGGIDTWTNKISLLALMFQLSFDVNEEPTKVDEITDEALEMLKFIDIRDDEKVWMTLMGRRELIPIDKLRGLLFDGSEFKTIFETTYTTATDVSTYLKLATANDESRKKRGRFLYEPETDVHRALFDSYNELVQRSEKIVSTFNKGIEEAEARMRSKGEDKMQIQFRLENSSSFVYSPMKVDGGYSLLVDFYTKNNSEKALNKFHKDTGNFYKDGFKEDVE